MAVDPTRTEELTRRLYATGENLAGGIDLFIADLGINIMDPSPSTDPIRSDNDKELPNTPRDTSNVDIQSALKSHFEEQTKKITGDWENLGGPEAQIAAYVEHKIEIKEHLAANDMDDEQAEAETMAYLEEMDLNTAMDLLTIAEPELNGRLFGAEGFRSGTEVDQLLAVLDKRAGQSFSGITAREQQAGNNENEKEKRKRRERGELLIHTTAIMEALDTLAANTGEDIERTNRARKKVEEQRVAVQGNIDSVTVEIETEQGNNQALENKNEDHRQAVVNYENLEGNLDATVKQIEDAKAEYVTLGGDSQYNFSMPMGADFNLRPRGMLGFPEVNMQAMNSRELVYKGDDGKYYGIGFSIVIDSETASGEITPREITNESEIAEIERKIADNTKILSEQDAHALYQKRINANVAYSEGLSKYLDALFDGEGVDKKLADSTERLNALKKELGGLEDQQAALQKAEEDLEVIRESQLALKEKIETLKVAGDTYIKKAEIADLEKQRDELQERTEKIEQDLQTLETLLAVRRTPGQQPETAKTETPEGSAATTATALKEQQNKIDAGVLALFENAGLGIIGVFVLALTKQSGNEMEFFQSFLQEGSGLNLAQVFKQFGVEGLLKGLKENLDVAAVSTHVLTKVPETGNANFDRSIRHVLKTEGGLNLDEPGGAIANFGINSAANPDIDVRNLTVAEAVGIYKERYWDTVKGIDQMSEQAALIAFDASVNQGPAFANKIVKQSGGDPSQMLALRQEHYNHLAETNPVKYGKYHAGWTNRMDGLRKEAIAVAAVTGAEKKDAELSQSDSALDNAGLKKSFDPAAANPNAPTPDIEHVAKIESNSNHDRGIG